MAIIKAKASKGNCEGVMVGELDYYVESDDPGTPIRVRFVNLPGDSTAQEDYLIRVDADLQPEHILWALLKNPEEEYFPYHKIKTQEWSSQWGGSSGGITVVLEILNNPWVTGVITALIVEQNKAKVSDFFKRIKSAPLLEDDAIYHAKLHLAVKLNVERHQIKLHGVGDNALGGKWVELDSGDSRYRVAVAMTKRGKASVGVESRILLTSPPDYPVKRANSLLRVSRLIKRLLQGRE